MFHYILYAYCGCLAQYQNLLSSYAKNKLKGEMDKLPTPAEQHQQVYSLEPIKHPSSRCMIEKSWWDEWKRYTSRANTSAPGPILNLSLVYRC